MKAEEIRILMAELDGWTFSKIEGEFRFIAYAPDGDVSHHNFGDVSFLPDYLNDLNAVHRVELKLDNKVCVPLTSSKYLDILADVVGTTGIGVQQELVMAESFQRIEALLKTFGKWVV